MDYLRKTFPNATNPMKMLPSPSLPSLKVQRLNVLNKLSTMKGSCIGTNSKDDESEPSNEQAVEQRSDLERRTVESKHISTVSSLVATKPDDGKTKVKDSQRNNLGLYALKFHRNLATHANSILMNLKRDSSKASESNFGESSTTDSPRSNKAARNRLKHEHFEPYDRARNHHNGASEELDDEFDEGCSVNVWNNSNRFQRKRFNNNSENIDDVTTVRAPVRPRRVEPLAPKANSMAAHDAIPAKSGFTSVNHHQYLAYDSTQSMDDFGSDQNVMNI